MIKYEFQAGTIDVSVVIRIIDAADGTPETGVVFNTAGIDLQYRREGAANVAITEATLAALTTAHSDGGFLHIGNGYYRLDLPDAACASGAPGVLVHGVVTGMVVIGCYIQLVAYNPFDAVRLGLTALPNVASGSAGAIPTTGTGANQISLSSGLVTLAGVTHTGATIPTVTTATNVTTVNGLAANVITAASTAADFVTEIQSGLATTANVSAVETDTQDIQSRLPSALESGRIAAALSAAKQEQIDDIQFFLDILNGLWTRGTIAATPDTTVPITSIELSSDFVNTNDHYNSQKLYILTGSQRGKWARITDQVGLVMTLSNSSSENNLTGAPEVGASCAIMGG